LRCSAGLPSIDVQSGGEISEVRQRPESIYRSGRLQTRAGYPGTRIPGSAGEAKKGRERLTGCFGCGVPHVPGQQTQRPRREKSDERQNRYPVAAGELQCQPEQQRAKPTGTLVADLIDAKIFGLAAL